MNATDTALAFDSESFDTDTMHDTVTNNARLTCKTAGKFIIEGQVEFAASATGVRQVQIRLNGTTIIASERKAALSVAVTQQNIHTVYDLAVNDYVELLVNQTSLADLGVSAGTGLTWFSATRQADSGPTGATGATGPTSEFAYVEFTATVNITATTEGTAQTVVSAGSKTYDGSTAYLFEFFSPSFADSVTTTDLFLILHDGSASLGWIWVGRSPAASFAQGSIYASRRITPAAGTRTYSIRGYMSAASTGSVSAGAGGSVTYVPGFVRITKVA